jgi:hypothetical protein
MKHKIIRLTLPAVVLALTTLKARIASAQAPNISINPVPIPGVNLGLLIGYAAFAAWVILALMVVVAAVQAMTGGVNEYVKRTIGGILIGALILTVGWVIITKVF